MTDEATDKKPAKGLQEAALLGLFQSVANLTLSVIRSKANAVLLGPIGLGIGAQVNQLITLALTPAGLFGGAALLTTASNIKDSVARARLYRAAFFAVFFSSFLGVLGSVLAGFWVLPLPWGPSAWPLVLLAGAAALCNGITGIAAQFLTSAGELRSLAWVSLFLAVVGVLLGVTGTYLWGLWGQFLGIAISTLLGIFIAHRALRRAFPDVEFRPGFAWDPEYLRVSFKLGVSSLIAALALQSALSIIRLTLEEEGGPALNGQFQAAWLVGSTYFAMIISGLGNYVFPRYASATTSEELTERVQEALQFVFRYTPPIILAAIVLREPLMRFLYNDLFNPAAEVVGYQMATDILRASSWAIAGPLLYKVKIKAFFITEIFAAILLGGFSFILIPRFGLIGFGYSYFLMYLLYLLLVFFVLRMACHVTLPYKVLAISIFLAFLALIAIWVSAISLWWRIALLAISAIWLIKLGVWRKPINKLKQTLFSK